MKAEASRTALAAGLASWIAPARTALLILDMQADFALPDGAFGRAGADLSAAPAALAAAERLARAARTAGATVIFVGLIATPTEESPAWNERLRRRGDDPVAANAVCRAGTPGAAFVGPTPAAGELVVAKQRYSAFHRTQLDSELKARKIDTLVVCGLTTECCVEGTVRDAFNLDYHVFVARDACAAYEPDLHAAALRTMEINCAILASTDEITRAWQPSA
jgi:ureidoacrylate peracid hydrolase